MSRKNRKQLFVSVQVPSDRTIVSVDASVSQSLTRIFSSKGWRRVDINRENNGAIIYEIYTPTGRSVQNKEGFWEDLRIFFEVNKKLTPFFSQKEG